jgi:hypothetical protein
LIELLDACITIVISRAKVSKRQRPILQLEQKLCEVGKGRYRGIDVGVIVGLETGIGLWTEPSKVRKVRSSFLKVPQGRTGKANLIAIPRSRRMMPVAADQKIQSQLRGQGAAFRVGEEQFTFFSRPREVERTVEVDETT